MHTGVGDIAKLGRIQTWQRRDTIKTWLNATNGQLSTCNMINGTDTTIYAPHKKSSGYEDIFATDICRWDFCLLKPRRINRNCNFYFDLSIFSSVRIYYKEDVTFNGIPAVRFQTGDSFLNEIGPEYGTECFCTPTLDNVPSHPNGCLYKGALDLTACQGTINLLIDHSDSAHNLFAR